MTDEAMPLELMANGTVRVEVGGKIVRLRRPYIRELAEMREGWAEAENQIVALSRRSIAEADDLAKRSEALMGEGGALPTDEDSLAELDQIRAESSKRTLELANRLGEIRTEWFCGVLRTLADARDLPGELDAVAEAWWATGLLGPERPGGAPRFLASTLIAHWMTVPLARSS
jgi:hypothetical protein